MVCVQYLVNDPLALFSAVTGMDQFFTSTAYTIVAHPHRNKFSNHGVACLWWYYNAFRTSKRFIYRFSIGFISGLLPGHAGVRCQMPPEISWLNHICGKGRRRAWKWGLQCQKSLACWPTHSAEESDPIPILLCTSYGLERCANGQYQTRTIMTLHHDLPVIFTRWTTHSSLRFSPDTQRTYSTCRPLHWMTFSLLNTTFTVHVHLIGCRP